jgi:hypothetical protein
MQLFPSNPKYKVENLKRSINAMDRDCGPDNIKALKNYFKREFENDLKSGVFGAQRALNNSIANLCEKIMKSALDQLIPDNIPIGSMSFDSVLKSKTDIINSTAEFKNVDKIVEATLNTSLKMMSTQLRVMNPSLMSKLTNLSSKTLLNNIKSSLNKNSISNLKDKIFSEIKGVQGDIAEASEKFKRGGILLSQAKAIASRGICDAALKSAMPYEWVLRNALTAALNDTLKNLTPNELSELSKLITNNVPVTNAFSNPCTTLLYKIEEEIRELAEPEKRELNDYLDSVLAAPSTSSTGQQITTPLSDEDINKFWEQYLNEEFDDTIDMSTGLPKEIINKEFEDLKFFEVLDEPEPEPEPDPILF